jgi:hypothetical protein
MRKKRFADGGMSNDKVDYEQDVKDFYNKHSSKELRDLKVKDVRPKHIGLAAKEAGLMLGTTASLLPAQIASGAVNTTRDLKKAAATKRQLNAMPEEFSEPVDMSTPRPPRRELNEDQKRSMAKERDLRDRYGSSSRGMKKGGAVKMAKGGSVSSASKRADGCAVKGKTRGMMR